MKQQLSALIDGEADVERCEHVFLAAKSTGEVAQAWRDYHVIRDVMRDEGWMQSGFTSRVMAELESEPVVFAPAATRGVPEKTPLASSSRFSKYTWSIAASVAAAFFVGMFVLHQPAAVDTAAQIADNDSETDQYVVAHHNYAPNSAAYYFQDVAFSSADE